MLTYLKVTNFALIDQLEIDFSEGFNVLTGETGAGKSILIKAIQLLLGERASTDSIREGSNEASIEAVFFINDSIISLLNSHNILIDDQNLIVKKTISKNGSKNFLNSTLVNSQVLKEIMSKIVSICGQHDNQIITSLDEQLRIVDFYGNNQEELLELKQIFNEIKKIKLKIDELTIDEDSKEDRINYLEYQLKEIKDLNPKENEEEELTDKEQKINGMKHLMDLCNTAKENFYGEDFSIISSLEDILKKTKSVAKIEPLFQNFILTLEKNIDELEELAKQYSDYYKKNHMDEEELEIIASRLEALKKLKRKYGGTITSILVKKNEIENELSSLKNSENIIKTLENEKKQCIQKYNSLSEKITLKRKKASKEISDKVTKELQELKMSGSVFEIQVVPLNQLTSKGKDSIVFKISSNKGELLKPMDKVASGGELSRIMLALTKVLTDTNSISVYIFDEIDAGIGGETGLVVGKKLQEISKAKQTICITHLPQVAVFCNQHLLISKSEKKDRVVSDIKKLNEIEQKQEIARMLGGNMVVEKALEHAEAMIFNSKK